MRAYPRRNRFGALLASHLSARGLVAMMIQHGLAIECARLLALGFLAPVSWEWSRQRPKTSQQTWPWVFLCATTALVQIAAAALRPELITQTYPLM